MIGELYLEKKAAVIIPALNPDEKLVNTVKDVRKIWNGPVVIVDSTRHKTFFVVCVH